jgi:hypothetical protein
MDPDVYYVAALNYHVNCELFDRTLPGFMHRGEWRVRGDYRAMMARNSERQLVMAVDWIIRETEPHHLNNEMVRIDVRKKLQRAMQRASRLTLEGQQRELAVFDRS